MAKYARHTHVRRRRVSDARARACVRACAHASTNERPGETLPSCSLSRGGVTSRGGEERRASRARRAVRARHGEPSNFGVPQLCVDNRCRAGSTRQFKMAAAAAQERRRMHARPFLWPNTTRTTDSGRSSSAKESRESRTLLAHTRTYVHLTHHHYHQQQQQQHHHHHRASGSLPPRVHLHARACNSRRCAYLLFRPRAWRNLTNGLIVATGAS